jgi:hypothetical protein
MTSSVKSVTALDFSEQTRTFLQNVSDKTRIVFFVGAGVSVSAGYPLWSKATADALALAQRKGLGTSAASYAREKLDKEQYYEAFGILQDELPDPTFYEICETVFSGGAQPAETHRLLVRTGCRGIITTNFDNCLESAAVLEGKGIPLTDIAQAMASERFFVLKPHGSISVPRSMVLSRNDWKRIEDNQTFRDFIALCVSTGQFVFMGYSMRDPDFNRMWDSLLRERIFRSPAIYCCAKGGLRPEQHQEFRERRVAAVEFPDDGSCAFIPSVLQALATSAAPVAVSTQPASTEKLAQELERFVFISLQFSPSQQNRLVLVCKSLVLEFLALNLPDTIDLESLFKYVAGALGQDSSVIREALDVSIRELVSAKLLKLNGSSIEVEKGKIKALNQQVAAIERQQALWVDRALLEQSRVLGTELETGDQAHVTQLIERVLMESGRQVAELFLFNRPPRDESEKIDEAVDAFCKERDLGTKKPLYKKTVKQMMFEPEEEDEDILFKKLQSYFIASAYVLDPTSEKLLSQYARDHWVYFDSSVILPSLAVGHPSHHVYRRLLSTSQALGMRLRVSRDMVNEVWANIRAALAAFKDFSRATVSIRDVLEGYIEMYGTGNGNVFMEGLLSRLRLDPQLAPSAYMSEILGTNDLNVTEEQVVRAISDNLGIECDTIGTQEIVPEELAPIADNIAFLRKQANRFKTQKLCEHEARQFYLIHLRRKQNPELATKIWFITTDRFLVELQRLEKDRYPLPISYTPRSWFQYLDMIDVRSRGSRHFSRLQPRMRFGVVSGELGIEAIQTILKEQRDLLSKGVVTIKELAEAAVRDYHVRQSILEFDRKGSMQDPAQALDAKNQIRSDIKKVVSQFVAVRVQEIDNIKNERDTAKAETKALEKRLAKEKHVARTLRAQQKARGPKPRRQRRK